MDMFSYLSSIDDFIKEQGGNTPEPAQPNNMHHQLFNNHSWLEDMWGEKTGASNHTSPDPPLPPYEQKPFIRKKAGRKPNPATPALRKAQNRAAQRAFRERKERHVENLENTIRGLREQLKEMNNVKKNLEISQVENWYLKGIVLTLQLVCMDNHINIPTHAPYLSDQDLHQMTDIDNYAKQAYLSSCTLNNNSLKAFFMSNKKESETKDATIQVTEQDPKWLSKIIDESEIDKIASDEPIPHLRDEDLPDPLTAGLDGIHYIQLKMSVKSFIPNNSDITNHTATRLRPSVLQLAVPHDPRIDLLPTQHMRDRMILFRNQMDYDRCFGLIINGAKYLRTGDPTKSENWQLPLNFYREFWFLTLNYRKENKNRAKNLIVSHETDPDCPYIESQLVKWSNRGRMFPSSVPALNNTQVTPHLTDITAMNTNLEWNEKQVHSLMHTMPSLYPMYQEPLQFPTATEIDESTSYGNILLESSPEIFSPIFFF